MALTLDQAKHAGELAALGQKLTSAMAGLGAATNAKAYIEQVTCIASMGPPLTAAIPLSVDDSAKIYSAVIAVYQAMLDAVNAELATMGS